MKIVSRFRVDVYEKKKGELERGQARQWGQLRASMHVNQSAWRQRHSSGDVRGCLLDVADPIDVQANS